MAGYEAQYFATVEPQRRLAPHAHYAIRGTLPRALVKELTAATYVNVWWPATTAAVYGSTRVPEWDPAVGIDAHGQPYGGYVDPDTRIPLTTWREALDDLDNDPDAAPRHTIRFGAQVDVQGLLAGSPQAEKAIGYIVKYLVKDLGDDLDHPDSDDPDDDQGDQLVTADAKAADARRADHVARLVEALRHEPCSPACANWLRYGIQPKGARVGMRPGCCRAKAHKPSHLGYGGRRVLVSRKWTAKDLADHKHDRRAFVLDVLAKAGADCSATVPLNPGKDPDPPGITWELAKPTDPDVKPRHHRLLRAIAERTRWRTQYRAIRDQQPDDENARTDLSDQTDTAA